MGSLSSIETLRILRQSSLLAGFALIALLGSYMLIEPAVTHSQAFNQFTTNQTVTAEISFVSATSNVTMDTSIPGISGGSANGATNVRVYTNNNTGFNMTMKASSSPAMQANNNSGSSIRDFSTTTTGWQSTPSFAFTVPANSAGFGYTVKSSSTSDTATAFMDTGAACGSGANNTAAACWIGASTTAYTLINRTTPTTASGATSTIFFRTTINSNPVPSITASIYTATTTLTATVNP